MSKLLFCEICGKELKSHKRCLRCTILLHNHYRVSCEDKDCIIQRIKKEKSRKKNYHNFYLKRKLKNKIPDICQNCGISFWKRQHNQKYCGSIKNKTGCCRVKYLERQKIKYYKFLTN